MHANLSEKYLFWDGPTHTMTQNKKGDAFFITPLKF